MKINLPLDLVVEGRSVSVYHHPEPAYPFHMLIVPKKAIDSLMGLNEEDGDLLLEIFLIAKSLVEKYALEQIGYRLILNGGEHQQFSQLHFHLISEKAGIEKKEE